MIKTSDGYGYTVTGISASSGTVNYTYYPSNGKLLLKAFYVDASTPLLSVLTVGFKTRRTDMDGFFMAGSAQETVTITMTLIRPITWTEPVPDPFLGPFYRMQEIEQTFNLPATVLDVSGTTWTHKLIYLNLADFTTWGCETNPLGNVDCLNDANNIATNTGHTRASADLTNLANPTVTMKAGVPRTEGECRITHYILDETNLLDIKVVTSKTWSFVWEDPCTAANLVEIVQTLQSTDTVI